jgi:hypothetical protein
MNSDGVIVDSLAVEEPDWESPEDSHDSDKLDPDGSWRLLHDLYSAVHRHVAGWDKVVKDIEKAIASPGIIGEPRK